MLCLGAPGLGTPRCGSSGLTGLMSAQIFREKTAEYWFLFPHFYGTHSRNQRTQLLRDFPGNDFFRSCFRDAAWRPPSVNSSSESSALSSSSLADVLSSSESVTNLLVLLGCLWWRVRTKSDECGGDSSTTRRRFEAAVLLSESPS